MYKHNVYVYVYYIYTYNYLYDQVIYIHHINTT